MGKLCDVHCEKIIKILKKVISPKTRVAFFNMSYSQLIHNVKKLLFSLIFYKI